MTRSQTATGVNDQTDSEGFTLIAGQHHVPPELSVTSQSFGLTDTVPHLEGPCQETQYLPVSAQPQNILASVQQNVSSMTATQRRFSRGIYSSPQNLSVSLQSSERLSYVQSPEITHVSSPDGQMSENPVRNTSLASMNTSLASMLSSLPGVDARIDSTTHIPRSPNQVITSQMSGSGQQGGIAFSQSIFQQGTNTSMPQTSAIQTQPGENFTD